MGERGGREEEEGVHVPSEDTSRNAATNFKIYRVVNQSWHNLL